MPAKLTTAHLQAEIERLQKKLNDRIQEEAKTKKFRDDSEKAFTVFTTVVEKEATATGKSVNAIICELAGIKTGKPSKSGRAKGEGGRRKSEDVKAEKAELKEKILAFLKKQTAFVSSKVIREGIGAEEEKKLVIGSILVGLKGGTKPLVEMKGKKAGATWSIRK